MSRDKGVCFVVNDYNWNTDTHYRHIYRLMESVAEKRPVRVLAERQDYALIENQHPLDHLVVVQKHSGLRRLWEEMSLLRRFSNEGYDRIYIHYSKYGGILAGLLTRLGKGKAFYWHCEALAMHRPKRITDPHFFDYWLRRLLPTYFAMLLVNHVITGSEAMVDYYVKTMLLPATKFRVLNNYIDLNEFRSLSKADARANLDIPGDTKVVLFVHRLHERKGAHYLADLARAVLSVPRKHEVRFLIVGDGPYRTKLESQIATYGLENDMTIVGAVANENIVRYYRASDIFIMPSDVEGFPRVLLEAMASDLPIISTDAGSVSQVLSDFQRHFIVPVGDMQSFVQKLNLLLDDPAKCIVLAEYGARRVEQYSLEEATEQFLNIIN